MFILKIIFHAHITLQITLHLWNSAEFFWVPDRYTRDSSLAIKLDQTTECITMCCIFSSLAFQLVLPRGHFDDVGLTKWLNDWVTNGLTPQKTHSNNCLTNTLASSEKRGEIHLCVATDEIYEYRPPGPSFTHCVFVLMGLWPDLIIINKLSRVKRT